MVFYATFNNISVISWQSVLLVEETAGSEENNRPVTSHWQTLSHNVVHFALIKIRTHNIVLINTDCIGSCKSNYHTIMATTAPTILWNVTFVLIVWWLKKKQLHSFFPFFIYSFSHFFFLLILFQGSWEVFSSLCIYLLLWHCWANCNKLGRNVHQMVFFYQ